MSRKIDMLSGSIYDKILLFTIPLALTGILQQLFNATDMMIVGRFSSKYAMAAVGSNAPIIGILINLFLGISIGVNVVIAKYIGENKSEEIKKTVGTAIIVSLLGALFLAVVGQFIALPILTFMRVPREILSMASLYFKIYMLGMPAILLYNFESAIFRAQGDTKTPFICLIIAGTFNVLLNLFFVVVLKRSADGVAIATVLSNLIGALIMLFLLLNGDGDIKIEKQFFRVDRDVLFEILIIGIPAGVQAMLFSFSNIIIQSSINSLGPDIMAASAAAFNIEIFSYFVINAFGQACTTFVGQNYGAKNKERCKKITRCALILDSIFTVGISIIIVVFAKNILRIFNDDADVIYYGFVRIMFIAPFQLISVLMEIFSGALRGYRKSLAPAVIVLFGVCVTRIIWVYSVFNADPSFNLLLVCYPLSWAVTAVILTCYYFIFTRYILEREAVNA